MKAITFNLLAWVMLPIMDGFAKYLSADLPVLQITWARYFFTVAFTFPIMFFFFRPSNCWTYYWLFINIIFWSRWVRSRCIADSMFNA